MKGQKKEKKRREIKNKKRKRKNERDLKNRVKERKEEGKSEERADNLHIELHSVPAPHNFTQPAHAHIQSRGWSFSFPGLCFSTPVDTWLHPKGKRTLRLQS